MSELFYKYHGAGNDFIMIDNRNDHFNPDNALVKRMCTRRFGIGADGLIMLNLADNVFYMRYFNSDGQESTMCGNGGRCFIQFLKDLNLIEKSVKFKAVDGWHTGEVLQDAIRLQMNEVKDIEIGDSFTYLNTGSPHHVVFVNNLLEFPVLSQGQKIRNNKKYSPDGTNVNFIEKIDHLWHIRTFERGVEDETFACGTGTVAAALSIHTLNKSKENSIQIKTMGGLLNVEFEYIDGSYKNIFLTGPAKFVYKAFYPNF